MTTRWNPMMDLVRFSDEMNRVFDSAMFPVARRRNGATQQNDRQLAAWTPAVDVEENEREIVVRAELPGLKKEAVQITLEDGVLTLSGERKFEHEERRENFVRVERTYGTFSRSFTLPPTVDAEKIGAQLVDGVLTVTLPKRAEAQPKTIKVS